MSNWGPGFELTMLAYRGLLIERPCAHCNTTDYHRDGLCTEGPCTVCGVLKHSGGYLTHPLAEDGTWRGYSAAEMHDWQAGSYAPIDFDQPSQCFEQMVDILKANPGLLNHYTTDLVRDYQWLVEREGEETRFVWAVRPSGTHIIERSGYGQGTLSYVRDNERGARFWYWNGFSLDEVNAETAAVLTHLPPIEVTV